MLLQAPNCKENIPAEVQKEIFHIIVCIMKSDAYIKFL